MNANDAFSWLSQEVGTPQADIDQNQEHLEAVRMAALEQATMIKRALVDNDAGAVLLDFLTQATIMTPLMQVSRALPVSGEVALSPADWAHIRAGQNSVVHYLRDQIAMAMQPQSTENGNG